MIGKKDNTTIAAKSLLIRVYAYPIYYREYAGISDAVYHDHIPTGAESR